MLPMLGGDTKVHIAAAAGIVTVVIALVTGVAFYVANYTHREPGPVGRQRPAGAALPPAAGTVLSRFFDNNRVGAVLSTLMTDVQTIQSFASVSTLNLITDSLTIFGMVDRDVRLRWDFALIALAVMPFLAHLRVSRQRAIKDATKEVRKRQADLTSTLQQGLQGIEVVQAFDRQDLEEQQLVHASNETVTAWLKARRVSSLLSPVVGLAVAICTGLVLWRGSVLVLAGATTVGALTVFLAYLAKFFQPVRDVAVMTNSIAQVSVGFERITVNLRGRLRHARASSPDRPAAVRR